MKRGELAVRRALLYVPLPPHRNAKGRPVNWTRARARAALSTLEERPSWKEFRPPPPGMPGATTLIKLFGSWNAAMEAAGWEPRPRGGSPPRDDDLIAEWQQRVNSGETVTAIAVELGKSPQALGRRLARYRARHPGDHRVPYPGNRNPGRES